MLSKIHKSNKGFTLVEVIVVAVIVAVLALVGIQLYQGYVKESRRNTAENLAASAAGYLQTLVNTYDVDYVEGGENNVHLELDGDGTNTTWSILLSTADDAEPVVFTCPANASVTIHTETGTVSAEVGGVESIGSYPYRLP